MKRYHLVFPCLAILLVVAGCSSRPDALRESDETTREKGLYTGLLHWSDPESCPFPSGCGPEFSLLDETLGTWTPLEGDFDPRHHHLVVRVDGKSVSIDKADRDFLGDAAAPFAVKARRYRLLSSIPYHDFLVEQASAFTDRKYGCELLWDKTFGWREVDGRVELVVRMTDTLGGVDPAPYLELAFDGETGHFLREELEPWGRNPCER